MIIREYYHSDYADLYKWLKHRDINDWDRDYLPKIGYVASNQNIKIAMGFLRLVEGKSAMIDALCTNPEASPIDRSTAIDKVVTEIINKAKEIGLKGIFCFTKDDNTLIRSGKFGFHQCLEEKIIAMKLGD